MKEYIEREAVLSEAQEVYCWCGCENRYEEFVSVEDVLAIPVADVVERKRGEWVYHECVSSHDGTISGYSCSKCNAFVDEETFDMDEFHKDFCGHCGADMRSHHMFLCDQTEEVEYEAD